MQHGGAAADVADVGETLAALLAAKHASSASWFICAYTRLPRTSRSCRARVRHRSLLGIADASPPVVTRRTRTQARRGEMTELRFAPLLALRRVRVRTHHAAIALHMLRDDAMRLASSGPSGEIRLELRRLAVMASTTPDRIRRVRAGAALPCATRDAAECVLHLRILPARRRRSGSCTRRTDPIGGLLPTTRAQIGAIPGSTADSRFVVDRPHVVGRDRRSIWRRSPSRRVTDARNRIRDRGALAACAPVDRRFGRHRPAASSSPASRPSVRAAARGPRTASRPSAPSPRLTLEATRREMRSRPSAVLFAHRSAPARLRTRASSAPRLPRRSTETKPTTIKHDGLDPWTDPAHGRQGRRVTTMWPW